MSAPGLRQAHGVFADWVLDLKSASGVYAIRDRRTCEVLYVGESHSGRRLYGTMTRHLQQSSRGYHGPNYRRDDVEVKVELCTPGDTLDLQDDWICRLRPRDNDVVPVDAIDEEVPF